MIHIKNLLNDDNIYGVDMDFIINEYVSGVSRGDETQEELKMICENLIKIDYIPKYNKETHVMFVDGGDVDGVPIIDLYFYHNGEVDHDNTPVVTVTKEFLTSIGF